jgi:D-alanyl-D-alanine carboxypeptidase
LVSLGFQIDKKSEQAFNNSLKQTAENAAKLGLAIEAAAAALTGAVVKMAQGMEQSFYQSKRLGGSVKDINAVGYAISQVGGNADAAKQSMEGIADFMRCLPGGKSYIQKLVGSEADASDVPAVMGVLAKKFASMDYANAKVQANFIGIDDNTLQAMMRDGGRYYDEYQKLAKKAGVDQQKYASDSHDLMVKVRSLGASFELLAMKITSALIDKAGPQIQKFKNWIDRNFDAITKTVSRVADAIMRFSDRVSAFVGRVMEWYDKLDPKSRNLVNTVGGVTGAIIAFNKAFGSSPVGIIFSLAAAIAVLYDDYRRWKETGDVGLVDWSKWEPTIQKVTDALETISGWFRTIAGDQDGSIGALQVAMAGFATYMASTWAASILATFGRIRFGMIGLAAYIAYESHKALNDNIDYDSLQKHIDAGDAKEWHDEQVSQNRFGKWTRSGWNWLYGKMGWEKPYDENLRTKGPTGKSARASGSAKQTADGNALAPIKTASGKTVMVAAEHQEQFQGFVDELEESGYNINSIGGYANRQNVNNPRRKSEHAHGNAIDINPAQNPNGTRTTDMPVELVQQLAKKYGLGWGLNWKSVGDPMHFSAGSREGGRTLTEAELQSIRKERAQKQAARKRKEQEAFITDRLSSLPEGGLPMIDGPFQPSGSAPNAPLLPSNVSNTSSASMSMKIEINIMGNADAKQVGGAVEKAGGNLLRNMQPAIR